MRFLITVLLTLLSGLALSQITQAEYFVDTDPGIGSGEAISVSSAFELSESFTISTESMENGMHTLYVRTKESDGGWSLYDKQLFYISNPINQSEIQYAECFIDSDPGTGNGEAVPISSGLIVEESFSLSTDGLATGMHTLYTRVQDLSGVWSLYDKQLFYVSPEPNDSEIAHAEYFVDTDPGIGNGTSLVVAEGMLVDEDLQIESEGLESGMHVLYVRVRDFQGSWTLYDKQIFHIQEAGPIITAEYFFDFDPGEGSGNELIIDPGFNVYEQVELAAEDLEAGTHQLFVRVMDSDNVWSESDTAEFKILTVSVDEQSFSFAVFPNPASEQINIDTETQILELFVYDMNGRQVAYRNGHHNRVDLNQLSAGKYVLSVRTYAAVHRFTFIKD
jgi:hypothetical protein